MRSVIFPVVLCEWESWSFTIRKEHKLRMFEGYGAEEDILALDRKLQDTGKNINDLLHYLYLLPIIIRLNEFRRLGGGGAWGRTEMYTGLGWG
jgi:hypothetical protein